ncbi:MAG: YciI family protein [Brevibacterium sp.]|nr:YciI family protein [Brevibacterium sp.]MDN5833412.1 YciI family protein [Brevibacterium sp.]MDN5875921.1 YciI family protein [Brevibacterium sp.]MDN5908910.1 YciI family protein [Brevibacterium sp.]MDN6176148.1 YciI family protein [Brevibacterium sp.]
MRSSLVFHAPEPQAGGPQPSPEVMEEMQKLMPDYADALYSAGVFVIDVESCDAALAWAEKFPGTNYGVLEVRAAAVSYIDGRWEQP